MYEIDIRMPGNRINTIILKNNKIQQQIIELVESNFKKGYLFRKTGKHGT